MYHISTISNILRQGLDSLAQWLEHWISTPAVRVRIPSWTWDFFQAMHHLLVTNFHIRKTVVLFSSMVVRVKAMHFSWLGRSFLPTRVQIVFLVCSRFSVMLFGFLVTSSHRTANCICESSFLIHHGVYQNLLAGP